LGLPRPCDHRHHPRSPGQRPRPAGALGPPPATAPAPQLALGRRLAAVVHHPPRPTRQPLTCRYPPPARARPEPNTWKSWADQPITPARGRPTTQPSSRKDREIDLDTPSVDRGLAWHHLPDQGSVRDLTEHPWLLVTGIAEIKFAARSRGEHVVQHLRVCAGRISCVQMSIRHNHGVELQALDARPVHQPDAGPVRVDSPVWLS